MSELDVAPFAQPGSGGSVTEQSQLGPSYDGTVMLDIGGDIGALIILTSAELLLAELELSRVDGSDATPPSELHDQAQPAHEHSHDEHSHGHSHGDHSHSHSGKRTHVAVRERRGPGGVRYAAIYPGLREGEYTVYDVSGQPVETVRVVGGEVAQLDWR